MKTVCGIAIACSLCFAASAFADDKASYHSEVDVKQKGDGQYEASSKTETTDAAGTKVVEKTSDEKSKTLTGKTKLSHSSETVTDPKGLGNKTSSEQKAAVKMDDKGNSESVVKSHSVDAHGTGYSVKSESEVDVKSDGTKETTVTEKHVTDPKGLGNKTVAKSETVTREHPSGTVTTEVK